MNFHTTINDLPEEIIVIIFQDLQFKDIIENCSNTCMKWRFIVAHYFMQPYLKKLARHHLDLRKTFESVGWTEECSEIDLILTLCERHMCYKRTPQEEICKLRKLIYHLMLKKPREIIFGQKVLFYC